MRECFEPDGFGWKYLTFANPYPLPNVELLVSAESQPTADERIPILLDTPAAVRGVSLEPMLGAIRLPWVERAAPPWMSQPQPVGPRAAWIPPPRLDWVIIGCESGPNRRPCDINLIRDVRDQCVAAGVPFYLKQMEIDGKLVKMPELDGKVWDQMPERRSCHERVSDTLRR